MATSAHVDAPSAVERLIRLADDSDRFDIAQADILPLQIEAANALFKDRVARIPLLRNRAEAGAIEEVRSAADLVPLLFAHTTYKSYPEGWLTEKKWDRLGKWLRTVSTEHVAPVDLAGVLDIDDWLARLEADGHFVSCSSGTTGKCSMFNASARDLEAGATEAAAAVSWATGIPAGQDRLMFGLAPVASVPRNRVTGAALRSAFAYPDREPFAYPVPPITVGQITAMVALRKAMVEGTAKPAEITAFEATSAERQEAVDSAIGVSARAIVESRHEKLMISGMWASLHKVAEAVRALGYSAKDFHPENMMYVGGGLKGASLPADYRSFVYETFNLRPAHIFQMYGMQEINATMPRCNASRYHVPPWLMLLLLDRDGETLIEPTPGIEQEGRAGFFDITLDGRWNGIISGDRVIVDYGPCDCGLRSPSIRDDITRYADLPGGDKISCSGTMDAYVRGAA